MTKHHAMLIILLTTWISYVHASNNPFMNATPSSENTSVTLHAFHLQYLSTETLMALLTDKQAAWTSSQAKLSQSIQTHTVWVEDDATHLSKIKQLINNMDKPTQQIRIQAELMTINHHKGQSLGVQYGTGTSSRKLPSNSKPNTFLVPLFTLSDNTQLNMQLQALLEHGEATMVANPELITLDQHTATIESGQEIPYQQATSSGGTSVTFKDAALKLAVTPTLLPHHRIRLDLQLNQDTVSNLRIAGAPAITTQQLKTTLILHDHDTLALGGITTQQHSKQHHSIPLLHSLPWIGRLFKDQQHSHQQDELLILLTPHIQSNS